MGEGGSNRLLNTGKKAFLSCQSKGPTQFLASQKDGGGLNFTINGAQGYFRRGDFEPFTKFRVHLFTDIIKMDHYVYKIIKITLNMNLYKSIWFVSVLFF